MTNNKMEDAINDVLTAFAEMLSDTYDSGREDPPSDIDTAEGTKRIFEEWIGGYECDGYWDEEWENAIEYIKTHMDEFVAENFDDEEPEMFIIRWNKRD